MSACGNFSVVGGAGGLVSLFNVQSGSFRGHFADPSLGGNEKKKKKKAPPPHPRSGLTPPTLKTARAHL